MADLLKLGENLWFVCINIDVIASDALTGDLVYVKVFGQGMVFVNSAEVAYDMFEKASSIYSDRSEFPMLNDLYVLQQSIQIHSYVCDIERARF